MGQPSDTRTLLMDPPERPQDWLDMHMRHISHSCKLELLVTFSLHIVNLTSKYYKTHMYAGEYLQEINAY